MNLSKRLEGLYDLIPQDSILVDIGTDHGLLLIKAVVSGRSRYAYGLDINELPLQQAHDNVVRFGCEERVSLVLSDGLQSFNETGDCFVLAGMGAETIWGIIDYYEFDNDDTIIVQSNTKHYWFRKTATQAGFDIVDEVFMFDNEKPVFIIVLKKSGQKTYSERELRLGPLLIQKKTKDYMNYLAMRYTHLEKIKHNRHDLELEFKDIAAIIKKGQ